MSDIINLLPEALANQIAAGEVIQRPASVVKELMENAIDAGSSNILLIVKNYGKSLIQVIDNGKGMSETDARMCFERHATSKIKQTDDLFNIQTMGFRGEALASIASIAEVELKTRTQEAEVATLVRIKSSEIIEQSYCQAEPGTSIAVKNLFYNVPARRKFLKTDSAELRYIYEEFKRVALAHPEIKFRLVHNDNEVYNLPGGSLKKRVIGLFRKSYEDKIVRVSEETDVVTIEGIIGQPDISRKQKGEQYIFVNRRYIKSNYLNHAIKSAFENLISDDQYPFYVLFLDLDPSKLDINVHPTKQEVKFDDERLIYNYLKVSVKHALGRYSLSPQLDFENIDNHIRSVRQTGNHVRGGGQFSNNLASTTRSAPGMRNWQSLYKGAEELELEQELKASQEELTIPSAATGDLLIESSPVDSGDKEPFQIHNAYVLVQIKNGFFLIDQNAAHQRILFERYLQKLSTQEELVQKQLFPITIQIQKDQMEAFNDLLPELKSLGFDLQNFGAETFVINGVPAGFSDNNLQEVFDKLLDQFVSNVDLELSKNEQIAKSMAKSSAIKRGQKLSLEEMQTLVDELFACALPYTSPTGKKCFINYDLEDLEKAFN